MESVLDRSGKVKVKELYSVTGMSCSSCASSLQSLLGSLDGVELASVNYANHALSIKYDKEMVSFQKLEETADSIGYKIIANVADNAGKLLEQDESARIRQLKLKLTISVIFSVPVFIISMFWPNPGPFTNWLLMAMSMPVLFWSGSEFFLNSYNRLKHLSSSMDTLVALSTGVAFVFSSFNTMYPEYFLSHGLVPHVYFESSTIIITLILLGRFVEERAKSKTSSAIKSLMGLKPRLVTLVKHGIEQVVDIDNLVQGEVVLVKPGERVPVDGIVQDGQSFVDESSINGEPVSALKSNGDRVLAGTINQKGSLHVRAEEVGSRTLLSKIIELVQQAQTSKPPIQNLVDKIARIFVPIVILSGIIAFGAWYILGPDPKITYSFLVLITVLIIACPCALGLATPTALMVGIGRGAKKGILIKNADTLEVAYKTDVLVLDKTGTITQGKPKVTAMAWKQDHSSAVWKAILMGIEVQSEHPISEAVVAELRSQRIESASIEDFESITGRGARGVYQDEIYLVGNEKLVTEHGISLNVSFAELENQINPSHSFIYFANTRQILGVIAVTDQVRDGAKQAITELQQMGIEVHMYTGDNKSTAQAIAKEVGIHNHKAGLLPDQKGSLIKELQDQGQVVAMVGDGINDSQGLAQADLGIAMGSGTDIAIETAGITLMNSDLRTIPKAIRLSKVTRRIIRQNLFWAFIYSIIAIPVAAGILYPLTGMLLNPMVAGVAMVMSSLSVVTNSLRLRRL